MAIVIQVADVNLLGTIPSELCIGLAIDATSALQISEPIGYDGVLLFDRGNNKHTVTFSVWRQHADPDTALWFYFDHIRKVEAIGAAVFMLRTTHNVEYSPDGFVVVKGARLVGCSTLHSYVITTSYFTLDKPKNTGLTVDVSNPTHPRPVAF